MRTVLAIVIVAVAMLTGTAFADGFGEPRVPDTYLQPEKRGAYGLGVHSDASGRPFKYETEQGQDLTIEEVKPDAYGLGVGMDQYGRPVHRVPAFEEEPEDIE